MFVSHLYQFADQLFPKVAEADNGKIVVEPKVHIPEEHLAVLPALQSNKLDTAFTLINLMILLS